jgi:hypothetical protein
MRIDRATFAPSRTWPSLRGYFRRINLECRSRDQMAGELAARGQFTRSDRSRCDDVFDPDKGVPEHLLGIPPSYLPSIEADGILKLHERLSTRPAPVKSPFLVIAVNS